MITVNNRESVSQRLSSNSVEQEGPLDTKCIVGIEGVDSKGYCLMRVDGVKQKSHRVAWELANGAIPSKLMILHKCDVKRCRNPKHLFLGTHQDNMKDRNIKGRQSRLGTNGTPVKRKRTTGPHLSTEVTSAIKLDPRPQKEIAAAFGVHRNTVCAIKNRSV